MFENRVGSNTTLYTLLLPSELESLNLLESFLDDLKVKHDINDDTFSNILVSLNEVTNNAIIHGNKENLLKKVSLNLEVRKSDVLIFKVADEGAGFDYSNLPDPTAPENLENLAGRGIFITRQLADQCIFNALGNEVELHFQI